MRVRWAMVLGIAFCSVTVGGTSVAREPCVTAMSEVLDDGVRYEFSNSCERAIPCIVTATRTCGGSPSVTHQDVSVRSSGPTPVVLTNTCASNEAWSIAVRWQCRE